MEDESYFVALIRMYEQSFEFVLSLPLAERAKYVERLDKLADATLGEETIDEALCVSA
jgi:hypothetical protein